MTDGMRSEPRTYADHLRDWENARQALAEARDEHMDEGVWVERYSDVLLDAMENLLDASAFKDSAALRRQTEIVQRIGAIRACS